MRCAGRLVLAALVAAPAGGSVPPPPPDDAPVIAESCGAERTVRPFDQAPATATPLVPATLARIAPFRVHWAYRIATADPRVGDLAGMELNDRYGLLAVTRGGNWLSFYLQDGTPGGLRSVGVAPMPGLGGPPTSLATLPAERTYVAVAGARPAIVRYVLGGCGAASRAVRWSEVRGTAEPVIVPAAYTYVGVVGRGPVGGAALISPYARGPVTLAGPNPLGALLAASNPVDVVPEIVVARRAGATGPVRLDVVTVDTWSDVRGRRPTPDRRLGILPRAPAAMASDWNAQTGALTLLLAFPGPRAGVIDLYDVETTVRL